MVDWLKIFKGVVAQAEAEEVPVATPPVAAATPVTPAVTPPVATATPAATPPVAQTYTQEQVDALVAQAKEPAPAATATAAAKTAAVPAVVAPAVSPAAPPVTGQSAGTGPSLMERLDQGGLAKGEVTLKEINEAWDKGTLQEDVRKLMRT